MVRIVLVGAGNIAQSIHLPLLSSMSGVRIVAICDRSVSKARILAEKYGIEHAFRSLDDALRLPDVDAVFVTTSTDAHAEVAMQAIEAGKHVFIERPAARTLAETIQIRDLSYEHGVHAMVGMNHRFRPDVVSMMNAVNRGDIGQVYYIKAGWVKQRSTDARWIANADKSGGGVLVDLGVTVVDMVLQVLGEGRITEVSASTFHHETKAVEDVVVAMLKFESGAVATIEASWSLVRAEDLYYCNVFGKRGSTYINPFRLVQRKGNVIESSAANQKRTHMEIYRKSYESEFKHFVNAVKGVVPMISTIDEAADLMRVVETIYGAAQEQV
jgi:predicted dehydrogenase